MAAVCPVGFDVGRLKEEVRRTYASVALHPGAEFHFHRGAEYAARQLGYDAGELARLPRGATESFAGVGNPFRMGRLPPGASVVDIGSGAGVDCLLAARDVGPTGQVIGIDMTDEMLERARSAAAEMGVQHVPRWPLQIPPPVATQIPPGRTGEVWIGFVFFLNEIVGASEARQAGGIGRGAVGKARTPKGLSTGLSCGQAACPRRAGARSDVAPG
jgi:hypothetical protein